MPSTRLLALDYGRVHTGVALSDATATIVRPLDAVTEAATPDGLKKIADHCRTENGADAVVVGMPVSLSGEHGRPGR